MALGGKKINADECDYFSYTKLKLRCPFCREPVHLKKGDYKKSHFAHFPGTDPKQVEECELRASDSNNYTTFNSIINRGQRLKIFQKDFLCLFIVLQSETYSGYEQWIKTIQNDSNLYKQLLEINNICCHNFYKQRIKLVNIYLFLIKNKNELLGIHEHTKIHQNIVLEVIDYLCIKSSNNLLEYLINYSIYDYVVNRRRDIFNITLSNKNVDEICNILFEIILTNPWEEAFSSFMDSNHIPINKESEEKIPPVIRFEYPTNIDKPKLIRRTGVAMTNKITEIDDVQICENFYFYCDIGQISVSNNYRKILFFIYIDIREGLRYSVYSDRKSKNKVKKNEYYYSDLEAKQFIVELSQNTEYINIELGGEWLIPALKVFSKLRLKREQAPSSRKKPIYAADQDWIQAIVDSQHTLKVVEDIIKNHSGQFYYLLSSLESLKEKLLESE